MALAFLSPAPVSVPEPSSQVESLLLKASPALPASSRLPAEKDGSASLAAAGAMIVAAGLGLSSSMGRRRQHRQGLRSVARQAKNAALAVPGLPEPAYRQLADPLLAECDAGFDPLDLATKDSPFGTGADTYFNYREAEVKHGRLAMLATVGWLSSEELQASLAKKIGLVDDLAPGELAPSLINGGLGNLPAWFLPAVFMVSAWIELVPRQQGNRENLTKYKPQKGRVPGDLSFDPLALQGTLTATGFSLGKLHNAEVKHGRAAMIGIVGFVAQEFITRIPVLDEDAISADRIVETLDKGILAVDRVAGLNIPSIPDPFALS